MELEYQHQLLVAENRRRREPPRRQRRHKGWWVRPWLTPARRLEYGHYNRLMQELRVEDENSFTNYVRMPPQMFDELLQRITPVIQRQHTRLRPPLEAELKLALTLRHLATGDRYPTLHYDFRCGRSNVGVIVQEVCQAIIQELKDEVMPLPRTQEDWKAIAQQFQGSGFPPLETQVDHEDDNHNIIPGAWMADMQMHEVPHPYACNRDHQMAKIQRDYLTAYFNSAAGSVPWQERLAGLKNQV